MTKSKTLTTIQKVSCSLLLLLLVGNLHSQCYLGLMATQNNCVDNGDETYTTSYNLVVTWENAPANETIEIKVNGVSLQTLNPSAVSSPQTISFSVPADGMGQDWVTGAFSTLATCRDTITFKSPVPCPSNITACTNASGCLGGNTFEDYNCNGFEDTEEPGVQGIQVIVYDCYNNAVDTIWTDEEGDWQICSLTDGKQYRVEFLIPESIACWAKPTHAGNSNGTDVQFVTVPTCANFSLSSPADYCQEDPTMVVTCFTRGAYNDPILANEAAIASLTYSDAGDVDGNINGTTAEASSPFASGPTYTPAPPAPALVAGFSEVGTVWGMVKLETQNKLFSASYVKAGSSLGPGESTGAIYVTDNPDSSPSTSTYVDLNTIFGANTAGPNPHPTATTDFDYPNDIGTNAVIGKVGLGDMDISPDESTLYVVNMYDRMLYQIPTSGPLNSTTIQRVAIPTIGLPTVTDASGTPGTCPPEDIRPYGTGVDAQGNLYVGAVCSCESISAGMDAQPNNASYQLTAYVWKYNGTDFTLVLDESLRFNRDKSGNNTTYNTYDTHTEIWPYHLDWEPWSDFTGLYDALQVDQNEPMLADIEFDSDGSMIIGVRDRSGDIQSIYGGYTSSGDVYRACATGPETWQFESNGTCGSTTTGGANNNEGPNGGEYYYQDQQGDYIPNSGTGGLFIAPGIDEVMSSATDAVYLDSNGDEIFVPNAGGIQLFDNTTGQIVGAYNFYDADTDYSVHKASGIGDAEACCNPAPLEIGNYVWCDSIANGIQDACEKGLSNMLVQLYDENGELVGQDTTLNGNYYFNQYNVDTTGINVDNAGIATPKTAWSGMDYATKYYIVFGNTQYDSATGKFSLGNDTFNGITTLNANSNNSDHIDSDVDSTSLTSAIGSMPANLPVICMTTDSVGCGNHRYDMGVLCSIDYPDYADTCTDAPCHQISNLIYLGVGVTYDSIGGSTVTADTDIDDGVSIFPSLDIIPGGTIQLPVTMFNVTGNDAYLSLWIDWNGDGDFSDVGESISTTTYSSSTYTGTYTENIPIVIPTTATQDQPIAMRWRYSTDNTANANTSCGTGTCAADGEVEDYLIIVSCKMDICLPTMVTVKRGARN